MQSREKQIKEMAEEIQFLIDGYIQIDDYPTGEEIAKHLYNAGYRKQSEGHWILIQERDCYYTCSNCKGGFKGYKFNYCPNCGAKMKGGAE